MDTETLLNTLITPDPKTISEIFLRYPKINRLLIKETAEDTNSWLIKIFDEKKINQDSPLPKITPWKYMKDELHGFESFKNYDIMTDSHVMVIYRTV